MAITYRGILNDQTSFDTESTKWYSSSRSLSQNWSRKSSADISSSCCFDYRSENCGTCCKETNFRKNDHSQGERLQNSNVFL